MIFGFALTHLVIDSTVGLS